MSTFDKQITNTHDIVSNGRKENGTHRSSYGATNGKCNNCNEYKGSCTCTGNTISADHPSNQYRR